jgi:tRNA A58 N-methylase Trm61
MKQIELKKLIREEIQKIIKENGSYMMTNPEVRQKVESIINTLKEINVDGETMEYILREVGIEDQMTKQLNPGV